MAAERSPLAPILPEFRDAIRAGGHGRNEALAKLSIGSGLSAVAVSSFLDGKITAGGPTDPEERAALQNSGWQPYSIKIGDRWVSYQRFEPLSLLIGVAADFAEVGALATEEESDGLALSLAQLIAKNLTSKTWLSRASDFFDALSDPERFGEAFVSRLTSSMAVPAIIAHAAGSLDENLRESRTIVDKIKQREPGLSNDIEARRNVWGDEVKGGDSIGPDFLSPFYASQKNDAPLLQEVARLKAQLSMPQRSLKVEGKAVELTSEQYSYYVQLSGNPARKHFEQFMGSRRWGRMSDDQLRSYLREKMADFRATARGQLKEMLPELQSAKKSQRVKARVKDGDTIAVDIRLVGTDAFEVKQKCRKPDGTCTSCGQGARRFMAQLFESAEAKRGRDALRMSFTAETTYGRPLLPTVQGDRDRLRRYTAAEAEARQARRGAHAFQFNTPEQYRRGRRLQCEYRR